jgi:AcrR family transcriptional regulator
MLRDRTARLPSGRHRIPDHEVRDHQRARLIEAVCALAAERGYAEIAINDIVARAGVSKSTFYRFYRSKEECLFDAHKRHAAALIATIDRACQGEAGSPEERLASATRSALAHLADHPRAAHLLTIGILSAGPRGAHRYTVIIDALRARLESSGAFGVSGSALTVASLAAATITHVITSRREINTSTLNAELLEVFQRSVKGAPRKAVGSPM